MHSILFKRKKQVNKFSKYKHARYNLDQDYDKRQASGKSKKLACNEFHLRDPKNSISIGYKFINKINK